MTKQEVAAKVAEKTNIGQHQAVKVVETVMEVITEVELRNRTTNEY